MPDLTPAERLSLWADKLRDLSASGLRFANSPYDRVNYQKVQDIAMEMLALVSGKAVVEIEPLRTPHFARPTPLSVGDAAVIDDNRRILLIQRTDNGMWAMPGGMLEVGESPAEGTLREVLEETGVHCQVRSLIGVFDSQRTGGKTRFHLYHFTFLCEPIKDEPVESATFAHETLDVGWFAEHALPASIDPGHLSRISRAFEMWHHKGDAFFDRPLNAT